MNVKISPKHDNMYYIRNNYTLKSIYDDENECINYTLSLLLLKLPPAYHPKVQVLLYWLLQLVHGSLTQAPLMENYFKNMNIRVPSEPILLLAHEFEKLSIH